MKKLSKYNTDGTPIAVTVGFSALMLPDRWIFKTGGTLRNIVTLWASVLLHDSKLNLSLHWFKFEKNVL